MKEKLPLWIFPLALLTFLLGFLLWNLLGSESFKNDSLINNLERNLSYTSTVENSSMSPTLTSSYQNGIHYFSKGKYLLSSSIFNQIYQNSSSSSTLNFKAGVYYAYSLLLQGELKGNRSLIQDSHDIFGSLLEKTMKNNILYPRLILGFAKTSRYTQDYSEGIDIALTEATLRATPLLKRQLFLEIGYYYFSVENYEKSLRFFIRSNFSVDMPFVYNTLLTQENTTSMLIQLIENNLVPRNFYKTFSVQIKQKIIKEAIDNFESNNNNVAEALLKKTLKIFPQDDISEDVLFLLGYYKEQEGNVYEAINYYSRVTKNHFLNKDPQALFHLGVLYAKTENFNKAMYYFTNILDLYPDTSLAGESREWIDRLNKMDNFSQGSGSTGYEMPVRKTNFQPMGGGNTNSYDHNNPQSSMLAQDMKEANYGNHQNDNLKPIRSNSRSASSINLNVKNEIQNSKGDVDMDKLKNYINQLQTELDNKKSYSPENRNPQASPENRNQAQPPRYEGRESEPQNNTPSTKDKSILEEDFENLQKELGPDKGNLGNLLEKKYQ